MAAASALAQLFRWKSSSWQATGKSGSASLTVDLTNGVGSGRICLLGADGHPVWWRSMFVGATASADMAHPQRVIVNNGEKQFSLLFEDKDQGSRFIQRLTECTQELRSARFAVVKSKKLVEMTKELERLRAENKELRRAAGGQSFPLVASVSTPSPAPSSTPPDQSTSPADKKTPHPPTLRSRQIRLPLDPSLPHPSTFSEPVVPVPSSRTHAGSVDTIVSNVMRNSVKRIARRASTPPKGVPFSNMDKVAPVMRRYHSLHHVHSWQMPSEGSLIKGRTSSAASTGSPSTNSTTGAPPSLTARSTSAPLTRSTSDTKIKREKVRKEEVYRGDIAEQTHLTPDRYVAFMIKKNTDRAALNTFFLVYRNYITSEKLLERLHREFIEASHNKSFRERLADMVAMWARDYYPEDFANSPELVTRLFDMRNSMIGAGYKDLEGLIPDIEELFPKSASMPDHELQASHSSTSLSASTSSTSLPGSRSTPGVAMLTPALPSSSAPLVASTSSLSTTDASKLTWNEMLTARLPSSSSSERLSQAAQSAPLDKSASLDRSGDKKARGPIWRFSREIFSRDVTALDSILGHGIKNIARELTLIDLAVQQQVRPLDIASFKEDTAAPSIRRQADHFNIISYWVASEVVQVPNLSKRVHLLQTFITLASKLKKLQNFNGLMAVIAGLNTHAVSRLKHTWRSLSQKHTRTFEELENFMDIIHNFRVYRHHIHDAQLPAVPYFGLVLRDVTLLQEGSLDLQHGEVNRDKIHLLATLCNDIVRFQVSKYPFKSMALLRAYFNQQRPSSDQELERFSKLCEASVAELS